MASAIIKGNIRIMNCTYKTDNYSNKLPLTWGFVQAGLDVETSAVCIAVLWFGLDGILPGFCCLASVPGWTNNNALPAQSPARCMQPYLKIPFTFKWQDIQCEVSNYPPHITAHLQGTQNQPHKSQPCKRAAIANTRQSTFNSKGND
jgi:hypothetical protein